MIFGGLGFIGHNLALDLSQSFDVHVIDNGLVQAPNSSELLRRANSLKSGGVTLHNLDIFDNVAMSKLLNGACIDTVFHLAGASSVKSTYIEDGFKQVLGITNELLNHLSTLTLNRIVYFSSSMVYGDFCHDSISENHAKNPIDRYGALKYASEVLINTWSKQTDTTSIIIRPTAVYGPFDIKQRIVARFLCQASSNAHLTVIGDGENRLDFTYIDDVVSASKATLNYLSSGVFNISFGQSRSLNELVTIITQVYPHSKITRNESKTHPVAQRGTLNSENAIRLLGYDPKFSLEEGLSKLLQIEGKAELLNDDIMTATHQKIPLGKADIIPTDFDLMNSTLQTGWYTAGPQNVTFEQNFLSYLGKQDAYALSVNSCTSALILALYAHNITGGVIVPAFTFSATANAVILAGATPQFADIETQYLGLDPKRLEETITNETQAVIVVHLAGTICDIDSIMKVAKRHNLIVIEDCAQALAAEYNGQQAGTFGDTSCFSFFPTKMITTGEGGMLVTKHFDISRKARALANHGYNSTTQEREKQLKPWLRKQIEPGFNFRMSSINASLGIAQLNRLDNIANTRREKALSIIKQLKRIESIQIFEFNDRYSVYQALNILIPPDWDRDNFTLDLRKQDIMASVHYPEVLSQTTVFEKYNVAPQSFSNSYDVSGRIVTLPLFGSMTELQIQRVIGVVKETVNKFESARQSLKVIDKEHPIQTSEKLVTKVSSPQIS